MIAMAIGVDVAPGSGKKNPCLDPFAYDLEDPGKPLTGHPHFFRIKVSGDDLAVLGLKIKVFAIDVLDLSELGKRQERASIYRKLHLLASHEGSSALGLHGLR